MNTLKRTALATGIAMVLSGTAYAGVNSGLVVYLPFDGNALDKSGNARHGTEYGQPAYVPGKLGQAVQFDGNHDNYITVAHDEALNFKDSFTMSLWIYRHTDPEYGHWVNSIVIGKGRDCLNSYLLSRNGQIFQAKTDGDCGDRSHYGYAGSSIPQREWHLITAVFDKQQEKIRYYLDGTLKSESDPILGGYQVTNNYPLVIGRHFVAADGTGQFQYPAMASVDEVRIYNRALSECEINTLYTGKNECNQGVCVLDFADIEPNSDEKYPDYFNEDGFQVHSITEDPVFATPDRFLSCYQWTFPNMTACQEAVGTQRSIRGLHVQWVAEGGDFLSTVGGFSILEYKNAGKGGMEWTITGSGSHSGNGSSTLWLLTAPNTASVTFSKPSSAIGFMMAGDSNDGYARFLVDGVNVGEFDLYNLGNQTLIVSGLEFGIHTIEVVQLGRKNPASISNDIAIFGGAALDALDVLTAQATSAHWFDDAKSCNELKRLGILPQGVRLLATGLELEATITGSQVNLELVSSSEEETAQFLILRGEALDNGGTLINTVCEFNSGGSPYICTDDTVGDTYQAAEIEYDGDLIVYEVVKPKRK